MHILKMLLASSFLLLMLSLTFSEPAHGSTFNITIAPGKPMYDVSETASIAGNVTKDGAAVTDALVALEVDDPAGALFTIRALKTGDINTTTWPVQTLVFNPCDSVGNPKYVFSPGNNVYFKINIKNNAMNVYNVTVTITILYSNAVPFYAEVEYISSIEAGKNVTIFTTAIPIPVGAVTGNATAYVNVFNKLPRDNGVAYCPETSTSFILGTGSTPRPSISVSGGQFDMSIPLTSILLWLGNYTAYGNTNYNTLILDTCTFELALLGDLYKDQQINMRDIAVVARAFSTQPGDPLWNPAADLNHDNKVNMIDVAMVARNYGVVTKGYPP